PISHGFSFRPFGPSGYRMLTHWSAIEVPHHGVRRHFWTVESSYIFRNGKLFRSHAPSPETCRSTKKKV
ncbi:hypothetical protein VSU19_12570, partial [Verrucomicrobiales bacterium BCK34]|nr:hypothetical protein [Verrucomicrobiales bacterium BCK34]